MVVRECIISRISLSQVNSEEKRPLKVPGDFPLVLCEYIFFNISPIASITAFLFILMPLLVGGVSRVFSPGCNRDDLEQTTFFDADERLPFFIGREEVGGASIRGEGGREEVRVEEVGVAMCDERGPGGMGEPEEESLSSLGRRLLDGRGAESRNRRL